MKIKLLAIGKTDNKALVELIEYYCTKLKHYIQFDFELITSIKNSKNINYLKKKEGELILSKTQPTDRLVLLDIKGKEYTSDEFSRYLQNKMHSGIKQLVFVIGGAYGFSEAVYTKTDENLSLSKMTFTHQMIRLFAVEQIYRAFTILHKQAYHHK
ncbi:MAG: 23S rRNA (pseudouridine(1915)-N(3))-methyltransferase RlmH [Tenacibaculum sp.]